MACTDNCSSIQIQSCLEPRAVWPSLVELDYLPETQNNKTTIVLGLITKG